MTIADARTRMWMAAVLAAGVIFLGGAVAAPIAVSSDWTTGPWLGLLYAPTCHQIPERCLDLGAGPMAVCARCAGLYVGALLGVAVSMLLSRPTPPKLRWLIATALPSLVDFALGFIGLPDLPNWPRFAVATAPGLVLGLLLGGAIAEIGRTTRRTRGGANHVE